MPIALITDFGNRDWFTGEMKGVMLKTAPDAVIIDITHEIPPGDIKVAAFCLLSCFRSFPGGTVFCVVVDPGVGSLRTPIAVQTGPYFFIGPDNGVLSWALRKCHVYLARRIENHELLPPMISTTFHGRDIFSPIAGYLTAEGDFESIGPLQPDIVELPWPEPVREKDHITSTIIHIDRFGNAVTAIDREALSGHSLFPTYVIIEKSGKRIPVKAYYQEVSLGHPLAYWGSAGFLEVAVNCGSAAEVLGMKVGESIVVPL